MNDSTDELARLIDAILPASAVLEKTTSFLDECGWTLEIDEESVDIPKGAELIVRSRAFIKADLDDVFLGDHFEAVVLLGREDLGDNISATKYGVLRMYFNLDGQFVSEDRYNKFK